MSRLLSCYKRPSPWIRLYAWPYVSYREFDFPFHIVNAPNVQHAVWPPRMKVISLTFVVTVPGVFELIAVHQKVVLIFLIAVRHYGVIVVIRLVFGFPRHFVLLLEATPSVGEPRGHLGERHLGDDSQHDLLALGWVRILLVFVQPRLQCRRRFSRGVLPPRCQIVPGTVTETGTVRSGIPKERKFITL